ncbi:hypothetical protein D2E83_11440 [Mycobacteroides abscessus]|nr:hypothetical protein DDJ40_08435 [Mycobacteroides abscessus]RIU40375.1 hypothetical protein D2E83_11440 [Mycobacteroides abscessus]
MAEDIGHLDFEHTITCEGILGDEQCEHPAEYKFLIHELDQCTANPKEMRVLLLCGWCASKRWMDVKTLYSGYAKVWPHWIRRCSTCGLIINDIKVLAQYQELPKTGDE